MLARFCLIAGLTAVLSTVSHSALAQSDPAPPSDPDTAQITPAAVEPARGPVLDPDLPDDQLAAAASELARRAADSTALDDLTAALDPSTPARTRRALLLAISENSSLDTALIGPVASNIDPQDVQTTTLALKALGGSGDRSAIAPIVKGLLADWDATPAALRAQVFQTLRRQTGRSQAPDDPAQWLTWWDTTQFLPEPEWRRQLSQAQADRADRLEARLGRATQQVVELKRQLHALTPEDDRPAFLAELIASDSPPIRALGVQLATRRMLNARPIADPIVPALVLALNDPAADLREGVARILARIARPDIVPSVLDALGRETDPRAAAAELRAAARSPQPRLEMLAMRWIDENSPASPAAVEALWSLVDGGFELTAPVRDTLRRILPAQQTKLPTEGLRLLVYLGAIDPVVSVLADPDDQRAIAAARALVEAPQALDRLVQAALDRPALAPPALDAIARHDPGPSGYLQAVELADALTEPPVAQLRPIAATLNPRQLLEVARSVSTPQRRVLALEPALDAGFFASPGSPVERAASALLLVRALLALNRVPAAVAALDAVPQAWRGPQIRALRIEAVLRGGQLEVAQDATAQAIADLGDARPFVDAWLRAARLTTEPAAQAAIARMLLDQFATHLRPYQASQASALAQATPPRPASDPTDEVDEDPPPDSPPDDPQAHP